MPKRDTDNAPPPLAAVCTNLIVGLIGLFCLPNFRELDDIIGDGSIFTNRVFPNKVSVQALVSIRLCYALICFYVPIAAHYCGNIVIEPTYLPRSRLRPTTIVVNGIKVLFPFTAWGWNLLGLQFAMSSFIAFRLQSSLSVPMWWMRCTFILWETTAPITLMVSSVVKYAIWPTVLKRGQDTSVLKTHRALLQHNFNVFMAFSELCLLGGLPIYSRHASFSLILGSLYVCFTWAVRNLWNPRTGPAFIYFFLDTTLGAVSCTMALLALTSAMVTFFFLFCLLAAYSEESDSGWVHLGLVAGAFALVARFRD